MSNENKIQELDKSREWLEWLERAENNNLDTIYTTEAIRDIASKLNEIIKTINGNTLSSIKMPMDNEMIKLDDAFKFTEWMSKVITSNYASGGDLVRESRTFNHRATL